MNDLWSAALYWSTAGRVGSPVPGNLERDRLIPNVVHLLRTLAL